MTFLNALLAAGTLAFTLPLLIHLLNRHRFQVIDWGGMQFLEVSQNQNSRKLEWKNWLLLLLRCLIPVFLALAMSRPFVLSWSASNANEKVAIAFLLDDSLSMQANRSDGTRRWDYAIEQIQEIERQLPAGSVATTIRGPGVSPRVANVPGETPGPRSTGGELQFAESVSLALQWLGKEPISHRKIVLISDFQKRDWEGRSEETAETLKRIDDQLIVPKFACIDVVEDPVDSYPEKEFPNVWIEELNVAPKRIVPGSRVELRATLVNGASQPWESVRVRFFLHEQEIEEQRVRLEANSQAIVTSYWHANDSEAGMLRVTIDVEDLLVADNEALLPIRVTSPIPVLIVDGDRREERMASESDFVRMALAPFSEVSLDERQMKNLYRGPGETPGPYKGIRTNPFDCQVIDAANWSEEDLRDRKVLLLCNVATLSEQQIQEIRSWVDRGGGLIVFPGDRWDIASWSQMKDVNSGGIRIAELGERVKRERGGLALDPITIDMEVSQSGVTQSKISQWEVLRGMSRGSRDALGMTTVESYIEMRLPDQTDAEIQGSEIKARLSNDVPWIVYRSVGEGNIAWFSTSCDMGDSNLPTRAAFVPLMHRVVENAASGLAIAPSPVPSNRASESNLQRWTGEERKRYQERVPGAFYSDAQGYLASSGESVMGREIWRWFWGIGVVCFLLEMFVRRPM